MSMKNLDVVCILNNIATLLEFQGVEFKPRAYRRAAQSIEDLSEDINEIYRQGKLEEIPGVGKHIAEKITEIITTGKLKYYEDLRKEVKIDIEQLSQIPSLGPKKIQLLYKNLHIRTLADLERAVQQQKIRTLPGFGEESEKKIAAGLQFLKSKPKRFLYAQALPYVLQIKNALEACPDVEKVEVAGSFRRGRETVGDLDFLAVSPQPQKVMKFFTTLPDTIEVLARGDTKSSIRLSNGLQVDLRVVQEKEFGSAMNYFIGSKEHNVALRTYALTKGYTLSEYGLFRVKGRKWVAGRTEEDIYQKLKMTYIEPELRENTGEIEAALQGRLPKLIEKNDIKGIFHHHSTWSDGNSSLLEMAQEAERLGFEFISFNDHFGPIGITNPLNEKRLAGYLREIEQVRKKARIKVLSGVEIDIMKDGTLPLSAEKLCQLDVVIASVHLSTSMPEEQMTQRVDYALEHYPINILGHPTDRLINERPPLQLNLEKVFAVARRKGVFLEINASSQRTDLPWNLIKAAKEKGCRFALSTDAHDTTHLQGYKYGVLNARRGWLEAKEVLNCWSWEKIKKALKR